MRRRISFTLLYLVGGLMFFGGIGDQFINHLLDVHLKFLGNPSPSELLDRTEEILLAMLHSIGGGLMASGFAILALTHFALRSNQIWSKWAILVVAWLAQGFNGYGMYIVGSYYYYPVAILATTTVAVIMFKPR